MINCPPMKGLKLKKTAQEVIYRNVLMAKGPAALITDVSRRVSKHSINTRTLKGNQIKKMSSKCALQILLLFSNNILFIFKDGRDLIH